MNRSTRDKDSISIKGLLIAKHIRDGVVLDKRRSTERVTISGVCYIVDSFQNSTSYPLDAFKYHACGTSSTAEGNNDTALGAQVETRVIGSQGEAQAAYVYKTVATITMTGSHAIAEHGLFSASSGGTLLDRSVFSAINVESGDSIQFTYQMILTPTY